MLREVVSSLRSTKASRDPVALFRQLSHQYASSSAPASKADTPSQTSPAVDTLRQRLAAGMACSVIQAAATQGLKTLGPSTGRLYSNVERCDAGPDFFDFTSAQADDSYSVRAPSWKVSSSST